MKRNTIISSLVAIGIAAIGLQPASAQSFAEMQNYLRAQSNGGGYAQVSNNINIGLNNVQNQISAKLASGQLSSYDASMLESRIQEVAAMSRALGSDGRYSSREIQQLLGEMNQLNVQLSSAGGFNGLGYGTYNTVGFGNNFYTPNPVFNNFNSVTAYQQQLLNQINSNRYSLAQRQMWRNEYNAISPYINRNYISGNYGTNPYVRRMIRLQQQIRDNQRVADRHDRNWDRDHRWR